MINIVIFGEPLSGKTTLLRSFAHQRGLSVATRPGGMYPTAPVVHFANLTINGLEVELATIAGFPWDPSDWEPLLHRSHGLVVTFDLTRGIQLGLKSSREQIEPFLHKRLHVAVLTKADLCEESGCLSGAEAADRYELHQWDGIFTSGRDRLAVEALESVASKLSAREGVRARLSPT